MELQEQIKAYTAWVNSQLKKRSQQIHDLSVDLKDGYALATVVEIVSGQELHALQPKNEQERKENVSKVLKFMKSSGIKLHHVSIEEIVAGNVKAIMQLILALAAHFKPTSIGGRKHSYSEKSHRSPASVSKQRMRKTTDGELTPSWSDAEHKLHMELESDLTNVRELAENLQKLLLEEFDNQPIQGLHSFEESSILQAQQLQSNAEKDRLQAEMEKLRNDLHNLSTEKAVIENRMQHHEHEILALRQDLLHSNLEKDKLLSEKAELVVELDEMQVERDRYLKEIQKKDLFIHELEEEVQFVKTEQVILLTRKDKEIFQLQKQLNNSSIKSDHSLRDSPVIRDPNSFAVSCSPVSQGYMRASCSPKLSRRSPVAKNVQRKNRFHHKQSEVVQTRILYFHDRDMTPSMTSISKRVGDITLEDFKIATKKDGNYRYVFKALDPELGTVKEEVFRNEDIIPGWEGKIVAWVEEEVQV